MDASPRRAASSQPNNALDRDSLRRESQGPVQIGNAALFRPHSQGRKSKRGATGNGCAPVEFGNPAGMDQALAASAFTRDDRRDILRATVFLCSTPLVTPRASSGWAFFSAAAAAVCVARSNRLFDLAQVGADARAAGFVDVKARFGLTGAFLGLGGICHGLIVPCGLFNVSARKPQGPVRSDPGNGNDSCLSGPTRMSSRAYRPSSAEREQEISGRGTAAGAFPGRRPCLPSDPRWKRPRGTAGVRAADPRPGWFPAPGRRLP